MTSGYEQFLLNLVRTAGYDYPLARTTIPNTNRKGCTKCTALLLVELSLLSKLAIGWLRGLTCRPGCRCLNNWTAHADRTLEEVLNRCILEQRIHLFSHRHVQLLSSNLPVDFVLDNRQFLKDRLSFPCLYRMQN